jgi:hypothetical protein
VKEEPSRSRPKSGKSGSLYLSARVIGQDLRAYYKLAQPMPGRVADLLKQLAQRKNKSESETE